MEKESDKAKVTAEARKDIRQRKAKPIMEELVGWLEQVVKKYGSGTLLGKAEGYVYTGWKHMMHCLEDGRLKIDHNLAENGMCPITLGRNIYLFCENHEAAENICIIISLLAICNNHGVDLRNYFYISKKNNAENT